MTIKRTYRSRYGNLVRVTERRDGTYELKFNPGSAEQGVHVVDRYTFNNLVKSGDLRGHTRVEWATPADIAEAEAKYGKTMDELVAEAEQGYDPSRLRPPPSGR